MLNAQLRETKPIWSRPIDDGGMFAGRLSVHHDPDDETLPYLAVCRDGWGAGSQSRRASLEDAKAYTEVLAQRMFGGEGM